MVDGATLAYYEQQAARYVDAFDTIPSRHLDGFLDRLPRGAAILELGCGGGRDSARIRERGFALDATDGTRAMVEKTNQRFDVGARVLRFDRLDATAAYEAVWAHACLLHAARAELHTILSAIYRALRPGGWHYANYKLGKGEGRDRHGRLHNFPSGAWLEAAYRAAGFEIEHTQVYAGEGADGVMRDWMALTVRRP